MEDTAGMELLEHICSYVMYHVNELNPYVILEVVEERKVN